MSFMDVLCGTGLDHILFGYLMAAFEVVAASRFFKFSQMNLWFSAFY